MKTSLQEKRLTQKIQIHDAAVMYMHDNANTRFTQQICDASGHAKHALDLREVDRSEVNHYIRSQSR